EVPLESDVTEGEQRTSGLRETPAQENLELAVVSRAVQQTEIARQARPPLIKGAELIITPDRDARFRPPLELTSELLDTIAQRTSLAKALPATLVIVAHPDDEAIGAGGLLAGLPDAVIAHVTDGAPRDERYAQSKGFLTREEYARARRTAVVNAM